MLQDRKVAVVGLGVMGRALVSGLVAAGAVPPEGLHAASRSKSSLDALRGEFPVQGFTDAAGAVRDADVAVLCVKPKDVERAVLGLAKAGALDHKPLLISIAAGVPVVRAMPNTPCSIGIGMTVVSKGSSATDGHIALASEVFSTMGRVAELDEKHMDTVTGLSASGCAFIYLIVEALADGGVMRGLPRKTATELVAQMTLGSAEMILASGRHPASLKDDVTTPAGCTIAGILALEDGKIRSVLARAVETASEVAGRLAKN